MVKWEQKVSQAQVRSSLSLAEGSFHPALSIPWVSFRMTGMDKGKEGSQGPCRKASLAKGFNHSCPVPMELENQLKAAEAPI